MSLDRVLTPIKCSSEQLAAWKRAAGRDERSLSGWVRVVLDAAAGVSVETPPEVGAAKRAWALESAAALAAEPVKPAPRPVKRVVPEPASPDKPRVPEVASSDPMEEARRRLAALALGREVSPVSKEWSARRGKS